MWIRKFEYEYLTKSLKSKEKYIENLEENFKSSNKCYWKLLDEFSNFKKHTENIENKRKSEARMKNRKESHEYAKLCLEKAKYELDCGNAENAKILFGEYENNIDYRVEEEDDLVK